MLAIAALITQAACPTPTTPSQLLDAYRAAAGAPARSHGTLVAHYSYQGSGLSGEVTSIVDLESGRYFEEQRAGIVQEVRGFDGRTAWTRDLSMFAKPQGGGDRPLLAVNEAYRGANMWWRADRGGASLEPLPCNGVRITPKGGKPFEAWFDPATHLLTRLHEDQSFGSSADTRFDNYARRAGRLVPTRIEISYGSGSSDILSLRSTTLDPARAPARYSMPLRQPDDCRLPENGRVTIPFRMLNNHIVVDVGVDGHAPLPFIVDTGGHNILTPTTVAMLGIESRGSAQSSGAGEKATTNGYARIRSLAAGSALLVGPTVVVLDFSPPAVEGLQVGGMLGVEFLERFVVRIDYGARTITFIDPKRFGSDERQSSGTAIAMRFYDHMPQVDGTIDGRLARFNIDTGARDEVTLTSPFVAAKSLRAAYPFGVELTTGWGVGGPARTYASRARSLTLGPVVVHRPVVALSSAKHGAFSDPNYDGNVGTGLLKRFVTTFDYSRRTMYLRPLARPDEDVGRFDRSGMWINLASAGFQIMDIAPGGPADEAGLKVGDVITAIGAIPYDRRSLSETRRALRLVPLSRPLEVSYRRGSSSGVARLFPRDLIPD